MTALVRILLQLLLLLRALLKATPVPARPSPFMVLSTEIPEDGPIGGLFCAL